MKRSAGDAHHRFPQRLLGYLSVTKGTRVSNKSIASDLTRLDLMTDGDIDYSDVPPLDQAFLTKATVAWPPGKKPRSITTPEFD